MVREIVRVNVGQEFDITLKGVPTAGFSWELVPSQESTHFVGELGHDWQPMSQSKGGYAVQIFHFKALSPGEALLAFRYRRPWERTFREERSFVVRVEPSSSTG